MLSDLENAKSDVREAIRRLASTSLSEEKRWHIAEVLQRTLAYLEEAVQEVSATINSREV